MPNLERRWMVLAQDGRHSWLGRASDPSPDELASVADALDGQGIAAWLAVSEGAYFSGDKLAVIAVRPLTRALGSWDDALTAFHARRTKALAGLA
jgi:hypothetical protein